jgi:glucose-1-phosphate adenylyltransferase
MTRERRTLGLIVTGGALPLGDVAVGQDPALTPFAGQYRFIDFALATLRNSGVSEVRVMAPCPTALRAHLDAVRPPGRGQRVTVVPLSTPSSPSRASRLLTALAVCPRLLARERYDAIVVLLADHVFHVDLRQLLAAHGEGADVTLAALPVPPDEARDRTVLCVAPDGRVDEVRTGLPPGGRGGLALSWAGDLVISPPALGAVPDDGPGPWDDRRFLQPLADAGRLRAYDVIGTRPTGAGAGAGAAGYWHEPTTLEVYYDAQMDLCRLRAVLDLYDPSWPVYPAASGLGPAKVVADAAGRAGHAVNTLVSDGAIIRGAMVVNGVLGQGVVVESGAEVEDTVLLDGCRIGRNARVRRAVVGAGAVVGDGEEVGFSGCPPPHARIERSGLTVLPAAAR